MKAEKISLTIDSICKELGIPYNSTNPHYVELAEDVEKMSIVYLQLKEMIGTIKEIEDRHNLKEVRKKFEIILKDLQIADHLIIKLARKLKEND